MPNGLEIRKKIDANYNFVHLHNHTEYSVLDGSIRCEELAKRAKELGQPAVAITDHGSLHGVLSFYKNCLKHGVKPIIGVEAYVTETPDNSEEKLKDNYHMVLLAKNNEGYKDLLWLISNANKNNFYYKPRIWIGHLKKYSKNLIATTACLGGPVARTLIEEAEDKVIYHEEDAIEIIESLVSIFDENLYLEIQDNGIPIQDKYNKWLIAAARKLGVKLVLTTDAHFLTEKEFHLHQLMLAMQFNRTIEQMKNSEMHYTKNHCIRSTEQMLQSARKYDILDAVDNTIEIANSCNIELELGKLYQPFFDITKTKDYKSFLDWKSKKI